MSRGGRRRRPAAPIALAAATGLLAAPTVAAADAAGPTDYRTEIVAVTPATDAITVGIAGGDSFVTIVVRPGHEVVVLGYPPDEEPYLRIAPDGTVEQNRRSHATYYNADRFGTDEIPAVVDDAAPPEWERIGCGGRWSWHDHRAHWMGTEPLVGLAPGDSLPDEVIPVLVDGQPVAIDVRTTLQSEPSTWPSLAGLLLGAALVLFAIVAGPATLTLATLVLAGLALVAGIAEFRSLPAETGPLTTWWLLPALAATAAAAAVATYGRSTLVRGGLLALAGLQLLVWGVRRRASLTHAVLPTDLPFWLDRAITTAVLVGAVGVLLAAARSLFPAAPEPAAPD